MATLHVLSHSPFTDSRLASCLRLLGAEDGILLCGDAVYALNPNTEHWARLAQVVPEARLYALEEDLAARGQHANNPVQAVDYPGFVALALAYDKVNTWL